MHAGHYPNSGDLKTDAMHLFYIYLLYERGKRFKYSTSRYSMRMVFAVLLLYFIDVTHAMDNADGSSGPRCGVFEGTAAAFAQWVITFKAWIAWKRPELIALMNGKRRPRPVRNPAGAIVNTDDRDEWDIRNTQLYGAIVSFVHTPIQASLHVVADGRGTKALKYLSNTFGSQTVGDRAEATARLQKSYFDQRAKMNEADVIRQFNEMSLARADIISAGGAAIDLLPPSPPPSPPATEEDAHFGASEVEELQEELHAAEATLRQALVRVEQLNLRLAAAERARLHYFLPGQNVAHLGWRWVHTDSQSRESRLQLFGEQRHAGCSFRAPHGPSMRCYDTTSDELLLCIHRGLSFWAYRPPQSRQRQEGTSAEHAGLPLSDACTSEPPPKRVAGRHRMDEGESLGWQYYGTFLSVPERIELINEQRLDDCCDFRRQIFPSTDFLNVSAADLLHEVRHEQTTWWACRWRGSTPEPYHL